jgi:hypothetical protein
MALTRSITTAVCLMLIAGCAGQTVSQGIYQGIYEGSRIETRRKTAPGEYGNKPDMDYQQYSNNRIDRIDKDIH